MANQPVTPEDTTANERTDGEWPELHPESQPDPEGSPPGTNRVHPVGNTPYAP